MIGGNRGNAGQLDFKFFFFINYIIYLNIY